MLIDTVVTKCCFRQSPSNDDSGKRDRDRQFTSIAADSAGLFLAHKLEALKRTQIPSQERNQGA